MIKVRNLAMVSVLCVLGVGVTRAARTDSGETLRLATAHLASAAAAAGLEVIQVTEDYSVDYEEAYDDGGLELEQTKEIEVKGKFPPGSKLRMRDTPAPRPAPRPSPRAGASSLPGRLLAALFFRPPVAGSYLSGARLSAPGPSALSTPPAYGGVWGGQSAVDGPGKCFSMVTRSMTPTQARLSLTVLPTAVPGLGTLELVTAQGRIVSAPVVRVVGKWQFDLKADNGWRVQLTPKPVVARAKELTYAVDFFKGTETEPFQRRDGRLTLSEDRCGTVDPSLSISLAEAQADDECSNVMARAQELGERMSAGGAAQAAVLEELMALQEKMQPCIMKQIADSQAQMKKLMDPAGQKEMQAEQDNFGCGSLNVTPGAAGAVTGMLYCGRNVQYPKVTGTMRNLAAKK